MSSLSRHIGKCKQGTVNVDNLAIIPKYEPRQIVERQRKEIEEQKKEIEKQRRNIEGQRHKIEQLKEQLKIQRVNIYNSDATVFINNNEIMEDDNEEDGWADTWRYNSSPIGE